MATPSSRKPVTVNQFDTSYNAAKVRVCVRVRPISAKEQQNGASNALDVTQSNSIQLSGRRFTFDSVFDDATTQSELYHQIAPSLMQSFLDGYNATIIAYGQTGSGKTYTMGSEAHTELEIISSTGLIPRFLQDLFGELSSSGDEFCLETSFLEVYGDDIHDLLDLSRTVLPLREDGGGGVACNGLTVKRVSSAVEAVQVLHEGTMNRSTAATFMNSTSSRSHAVFTLSLRRQAVLSKLTFVDLAGSERMKKTGAEGERAREGIQINMGLLALGNVINALADDERMQSGGKKVHVPYRQSKLTRLLQDALGGNSQTVFLACVSSSDANASETLSTLHYANRARNIQNAPIRNVDFSPERSQQYIAYISLLEAELIAHKFGPYTDGVSPLLRENDVNKYFDILRDRANCNLSAAANSVCFSHESTTFANTEINDEQTLQLKRSYQPVLENKDVAMLAEINPDAELAILDQLLELQQQDQDYDREQKKDDEALKYVEVELVEKERLLLHLRDSLKVYHSMKAKYESLIVEVQNLEREKIELSKQLEKASSDPALGCSRAIKKEIEVVERSLERARNETRKHRQMFNKAEQEAHKCRALELKIHDLKQGRANLIKKQREAAVRHRELTESKTKEIMALKRKDRDAERKLSKLETEIRLHKRYLDNRHAYCKKLMEQKKQAESHLMKLLAMRQRKHCNKTKFDGSGDLVSAKSTMKNESQNSNSHLNEEVESVMFALEKAIEELVSSSELKSEYEKRVGAYSDVVRKMVGAVKQLEKPSVEDREELIEAVRELDVKIELAAAELDKIQSRMPNTVKDDDEAFETLILQLLSEKSALVLRNIVACFTTKVAKAEIQKRQLMNTLQAKENIVKCFDSEVDSLNSNIAALKRELLRCRSNINSQGCCHHEKTSSMFEDISSLTLELEMAKQENILLTLFSKDLVTENENVALELHESKEKLAVAEISSALNESARPQLLGQVQTLWKELGISSTEREQLRNQIETCLKGTCYKLLDDAEKRKDKIQSEISSLREYICRICSSLELKTPTFPSSEKPLLHQLDIILHHKSHLTPVLQSAMKRRQAIVSSVFDLTYALDIPQSLLDENLRTLIAEDSETSVLSTISESFLSKCDEAVAELQIEKSKILSKNAVLHGEAVSMIEEMGLDGKDVISLVSHAVNRKMPLPKWWEDQTLEMVSRSVSSIGGLVRTSRQFSLHLEIVHDTMQKIAAVRSLLTKKLRSIVERTQRMLLKTVDGEFGTESELSIFQKELCGFSPLSREFICACFVEIESLCNEVGVMTQSEIEALTVVSEALNISSSNRGMFWDAIDQSLREIRGQNISPFDDALALSAADGEEWLLLEMKNGTKSYVELEARLFKLQKIHAEVEQLRDRQDSKSKIMSLDAQVRILNAQIQDFEGGKSNKQRLISKTAAGFSLLQEERFRKQIQLKLSFTLRQLISMLKAWKGNESSLFDEELLSDDVKNILKNSDRIEFLHLRTVENKSSLKRPADANQTVSDIHLLPNKRSKFCNCDTIIELPSRDITRMRIGGEQKNKRVLSPAPSINQKKCLQAETKNDKSRNDASSNLLTYATGKKRPVLDPFGNVLAHAISPRPPSNNKENP